MRIILILKALWIGATMTIPGVSGGTMAVVTGIYEELIEAINGIRKDIKKHLPFLLQFIVGAGVGFIFFARFVTYLLENESTGIGLRFLFAGIVIGGVPLLVKKSSVKKINFIHLLCIISGAAVVLLLSSLPTGLFSSGSGFSYIILQFVGGFIIAVALVLPGISVSHMLYILGLYEIVLEKVYDFQWFSLIPLFVGIIAGTFITTGILEGLIKKFPEKIYMTIIGFVAASIASLLPGIPIKQPFVCVIMFITGFAAMYAISRHSK